MGGHTKLKSSWHPNTERNQTKALAAEHAALEEKKKAQQTQKERDEERSLEHLKELQRQPGQSGVAADLKMAWMYQGTSNDGSVPDSTCEGYLLGKRRVDDLVWRQSEEVFGVSLKSLGLNIPEPPKPINVENIIRQDPLFAIKKASSIQAAIKARPPGIAQKEKRGTVRVTDQNRRRRSSSRRTRSRSPIREQQRENKFERRDDRSRNPSRSPHSHRQTRRYGYPNDDQQAGASVLSRSRDLRRFFKVRSDSSNREKDREARLARMQADAKEVEEERRKRVAEEDEKERMGRKRRKGGKDFTQKLRKEMIDNL